MTTTTETRTRGESSRLTLLEAALRLTAERGYVGTTMARITKATGLPASSVYWHFGNKDGLIAEAVAHGFASWRRLETPWDSVDAGLPRATRVLRELERTVVQDDDRLGYWRMGLLLALETGPTVGTEPREQFLEIRTGVIERLTTWWARSLKVDGEPDVGPGAAALLARLTLAAQDGLFVARLSDPAAEVTAALPMLAAGLDAVAHLVTTGEAPIDPPAAPPRPGTPPPPPSRDSRLRLLRAAGEVAAESGYEGSSISRICAKAGLPASSLYWHFADKDDLLAAVVEHSYEEWYATQPAWDLPEPGTPWTDDLRSHLAQSLGSLAERPIFMRLGYLLLLLRREDPPPGRARFLEVRTHARAAMSGWFTDAAPELAEDAPALAMVMMALSDGLFFSNTLDDPGWHPAHFADLVALGFTSVTR
jgi:AcrR family transcriptional regulator